MRATLLLPLVALALISTAAAQKNDGQSPLNCQHCWSNERSKLGSCAKLSKEDMGKLGKMTDSEIAKIDENHGLQQIKACLCDLSVNCDDILRSCNSKCPPEMSNGLRAEASIVDKGVCNIPPKPKLETESTDNKDTSGGEGQDEAGSEDNSANSTEESNSDDNKKPSEGGASSVQWSGGLLTVVAVMVSAVAF